VIAQCQETPFVREKFTRERTAARKLAAEYFQRFPKERYQTEVESWRHLQSRRLNMKESASVGGLYSLRFLLTLLMIGHIAILARQLR